MSNPFLLASPDGEYTPILTNRRVQPYKVPGDNFLIKLELYKNRRLSYLNGAPVEIWFNFDGYWENKITTTTDANGVVNASLSTSTIDVVSVSLTDPDVGESGLNSCLGIAKVTINSKEYISNVTRWNLITTPASFIIDAHSGSVNRSAFDIFDGEQRTHIFDRMLT